jgi:hypothetical protein
MPLVNSLLLFNLIAVLYGALGGIQASSAAGTVDVPLKTGVFRGLSTPNGTETFFGIPFAQPPVGSLRFKAPVAITKASNAIKDASQFGNACPQPASSGLGAPVAESCLFLNVRFLAFSCLFFSKFITTNIGLETKEYEQECQITCIVLDSCERNNSTS